MNDHEKIYLQPPCCADPDVGRLWSETPEPEVCEEGSEWTEYVRADLAALSRSPGCSAPCFEIPQHQQSQSSLNEQLRQTIIAANRLGLYDAADCIRRNILEHGRR